MLFVLTVVSVVVAYFSAPTRDRAVTATDLGINLAIDEKDTVGKPTQPSEWLEYSPLLTILVVALGLGWLY